MAGCHEHDVIGILLNHGLAHSLAPADLASLRLACKRACSHSYDAILSACIRLPSTNTIYESLPPPCELGAFHAKLRAMDLTLTLHCTCVLPCPDTYAERGAAVSTDGASDGSGSENAVPGHASML